MSYYCKYHPLDTAIWHCPACHIEYCEGCSPELPGEAKGATHYCAVCGGELRSLGMAHAAAPYWQHLGDFLMYPLSPLALGFLLIGMVIPLLAPAGMASLIACLVYLIVLMKYAYTALEYVASGVLAPVKPEQLMAAQNTDLSIKLGVLVAVLAGGAGYVIIYADSHFYGWVIAVLGLLILPLMALATAIDRDLAAAFRGESLKAVFAGLGLNYVICAVLLLALFAGLQSFVLLLADIMPGSGEHLAAANSAQPPAAGTQALAMLAYGYLLMVTMVAEGYLLFQFQRELNFTPAHSGRQQGKKARQRLIDPAVIQVDICIKEGLYAKAVGILRNESSKKGATLTAHERYHKLIWLLHDEEPLKQHAAPYFKILLQSNRDTQALSLMRDYLSRNSSFRPEDPDVCFDLAKSFLEMKEYKMAVHMLSGLHKDAPHYIRLPEAYLMAARVLKENLGLPQKALALVQFLEGRFKNHKTYPEIQAFKGELTVAK